MFQLNLPSFNAKIKKQGEKLSIFDPLRRRYVALTPEEWVRQNFVNYLINHKSYPSSIIGNEVGIKLNGTQKRCDGVIMGQNGKPLAIMEYTAPSVEITQKVFEQICRYNMVLRVDFLMVSNGMKHFCCKIDYEKMTYHFLRDIPEYKEIANQ